MKTNTVIEEVENEIRKATWVLTYLKEVNPKLYQQALDAWETLQQARRRTNE